MKKILIAAAACVLIIIAALLLLLGKNGTETEASPPSDIVVYPDENTKATVNGYLDKSKAARYSAASDYYYANASSKVFHKSTCEYAEKIAASRLYLERDRDVLISEGYSPCSVCKP